MENKRLLFVLPEYYPHSGGGISTYYLHYIEEIKPYFAQVKVIVGSGYTQSNQTFEYKGIPIEYLKPEIYQRYLQKFKKFDLFPDYRNNIAAAWALWEQVEQGEGFDIIECVDFGLGFIPWVCKHEKPVIVRLHGSSGQVHLNEPQHQNTLIGDIYRQTEMSLLAESDLLITHSKENQSYWQKILKRVNIEMIYPIYSYNRPNPEETYKKDDVGIVCGRIQNWKGPEVLCKALEFIEKSESIHINWFGRDTAFNSKYSLTAYLNSKYPNSWGKKIVPQQPLPHEEIIKLQRTAKYAIVPSTWDMFNFTVLEYMSIGTPVICSTGAGASELIKDGENGFKFENYDARALADRIEKINQLNEDSYQQIAINAYQTLENELSANHQAKKNLLCYKSVLENFIPRIENNFVQNMFMPNDQDIDIDRNFDQVPFLTLVNYVFKRVKNKLTRQ